VNGTANSFLYTAVKEICLQVKSTGVESGMATKYMHMGKESECVEMPICSLGIMECQLLIHVI
jgi:hypothetical protein